MAFLDLAFVPSSSHVNIWFKISFIPHKAPFNLNLCPVSNPVYKVKEYFRKSLSQFNPCSKKTSLC